MKKGFYLQILLFCCFTLCSAVANATVPTITKDPINVTVCATIDTYLYIVANDTPGTLPITYKWQVSTDGLTWSTLKDTLEYTHSGSDTLRIKADNSITGYMYRAIATNTDGADTSLFGTLTVIHPNAGTILGLSAVCKSGTITLSNAVTGGTWSSVTPSIATVGSSSGIVSGIATGYDTIKYTATNTCGTAQVYKVIHVDTIVTAQPITGPNATCVGHFITLANINTIGTGVWGASNGNATVSSSGVVTGITHGTVVINYGFTNACNSVNSFYTVTVDTLLSAGTISGTNHICYGSWVHLTETVTGGVWITGTSSVAVVDPSGNVTGVSQGTSVISYLVTNSCGVNIATDTVTVLSRTTAITGKDSVGIGNTRMLSDSTIGGMWFSSDTSIATIDTFSGLVTGKDTGLTTITYTVVNLCGTSSSYVTLHVGPAPTVSGIYGLAGFDSTVCIGATVALFDSTPGGVGQWRSTRDTIATVSSTGVVTGLKTDFDTKIDSAYNVHVGIDTIIYSFTNGFGTTEVSIPIVVNQAPSVIVTGPSVVASGGNYFFRGLPFWDYSHTPGSILTPYNAGLASLGTWTASNNHMGLILSLGDSSNLHIVSYASFVVLNPGSDTLTYTVHNKCGTGHKSWGVTLSGADATPHVSELTSVLKVYPNPSEGEITINLNSDINEQANIVITNVLGTKVKELSVTTNKAYTVKLDEPAGMYLLTANSSTGKYEAKIVIGK